MMMSGNDCLLLKKNVFNRCRKIEIDGRPRCLSQHYCLLSACLSVTVRHSLCFTMFVLSYYLQTGGQLS